MPFWAWGISPLLGHINACMTLIPVTVLEWTLTLDGSVESVTDPAYLPLVTDDHWDQLDCSQLPKHPLQECYKDYYALYQLKFSSQYLTSSTSVAGRLGLLREILNLIQFHRHYTTPLVFKVLMK
jgi:hypothetical protein